ncbi:LysR substrate-binding domain-containing protein (plasmid) [Marinobacter sp. M3C]|jgi:putative choline sulfate-utilization transcription factor|uniref:choline sulfate utilization transcriptional regulator n=1 Tax=Marinobacter sp. M3C TaxID=2917715 RepID=UPI0020105E2D|nr:LysR substrate-binding domain-containing protein [Marinobacter sp. M3C]UQG62651.1 LysR substrate-binding domain-containing protein [Marinobacter sp. M3C]
MLLSERLPSAQGLLIFEAAARLKSFTAAAQELKSTQSAVSQQIKALEARLGLMLFRRIYRGVALTEEGMHLQVAVQEGFQQIHSCLEKLQKTRLHQAINVATDFALAAYWLLPRLPRFRELHPTIDVRIITSQGQYDFSRQNVDVAILFDGAQPLQPHAFKLFDEEVFPICSPAFFIENSPVASHKKLASLPLLKLGTDAGQGWFDWHGYFQGRRSQVVPGDPVLTFNNYTLLIQAAIAGQGLGLGWATLVDDLIEAGVLVGLREFSLSSESGYYVVEPRPNEHLNAKQHFMDWLLAERTV